jgi:hypothetical protein
MPEAGFCTTSTAPYSSARITLSAPPRARAEHTSTGIGSVAMMRCRNVSPSTCGISRSSTMTSGRCRSILVRAMSGCAATSTVMPGSRESTLIMTWRITAESSTTSTCTCSPVRVCGIVALMPRYSP